LSPFGPASKYIGHLGIIQFYGSLLR